MNILRRVIFVGPVLAATLYAYPAPAEFRIGFINTLSGGGAILGKTQVHGWQLGLAHEGWNKNGDRLGGVPTSVFYADDQRKADVALRAARKMLQSNKVHLVAGALWSNVLASMQAPVVRAKRIMMSVNAGWSAMAGAKCSEYFISVSFQNDESAEAMGMLMNNEGIKKVFVIAPNYQAGKDLIQGFKRTFKSGKVIGEILFKLGSRDFQPEISRIRAARPDAVYGFIPGGMGISFFKQWGASGAGKAIKLYTVYTVTYVSLKPIGKAAVGTFHTAAWGPDMKNPRNQKFVRDFVAKYKYIPSNFAAQAYDGARHVADGLRAVKGDYTDLLRLSRAMRKIGLNSVRGKLKYNVNGFLIQPWYRRSVSLKDGAPVIQMGERIMIKKDPYWTQCPPRNRFPK